MNWWRRFRKWWRQHRCIHTWYNRNGERIARFDHRLYSPVERDRLANQDAVCSECGEINLSRNHIVDGFKKIDAIRNGYSSDTGALSLK